jgi:hypothetical protein
MLEDIKTLLGIADISKDSILNIYIRKATAIIINYLNNPTFDSTYVQSNFQDAIIELVVNAYSINTNTKTGIKQEEQGSRVTIYKDDTSTFMITDSIKNLLPRPYIKLF